MRRTLTPCLLLVALASCIPSPRPVAPPPIARPVPAPAPPPPVALAPDWNDWPRTPGEWRYARAVGGTVASHASGVELTCIGRRVTLYLEARTSPAPITVRTTSLVRMLTPVADPDGGIAVALAPNDPLLDAIAFSRGRFTVEQAGAPPLVLSPYAEIGRVIEDCRG